MLITERIEQYVHKWISEIVNLDSEIRKENDEHIKRVAQLKRDGRADVDATKRKYDRRISDEETKHDRLKEPYLSQITVVLNAEDELNQIIPRSQIDFSAIPQTSASYTDQDAQNLIDEVSKTGFIAWLKRMLSGRSRKLVAGELFLRIDNALTMLRAQISLIQKDYTTIESKLKSEQAIAIKNLQALSQQSIDRENKRHATKSLALQKRVEQHKRDANKTNAVKLIEKCLHELDGGNSGWTHYSNTTSLPSEILLGRILIPCQIGNLTNTELSLLRTFTYYVEAHNGIALPYTVAANAPVLLYSETENTTTEASILHRQFASRQIRFMPKGSTKIYVTDPVNRGRSLGPLIDLSSRNNGCGVCEYYLSNQEIYKLMELLTQHVDAVCRKLTSVGCSDIYSYNASLKSGRIPYVTLILNDFPIGFDSGALNSLRILINQAKQCGISILISRKKTDKVEHNALDLINNELQRFLKLNYRNNRIIIDRNNGSKQERFLTIDPLIPSTFFKEVNTFYMYKPKVDNIFLNIIPLQSKPPLRSSIRGLDIPFAVDENGTLLELKIGDDNRAYGFVSGGVGSGKTRLLHAIIESTAIHYTPDDVEMWLIDYKLTEFDVYLHHSIPHIRYVIMDKSEEITYSIIERIEQEIERRASLFKRFTAKDYVEYRQKHILPRILVVIDEFHRMSHVAGEDTELKTRLEFIFREARSHGIIMLLCDQLTSGLKGLSSTALKQISVRIAMRNQEEDIKETLLISGSMDEQLSHKVKETVSAESGWCIYKREVEDKKTSSTSFRVNYEICRALYIENNSIQEIINRAVTTWYPNYKRRQEHYDGTERYLFDRKAIKEYEQVYPLLEKEGARFYIGSPLGIGKCFYFALKENAGENLLLFGSDINMQVSILYSLIECGQRYGYHIVILVPKTSHIYKKYHELFVLPKVEVITTFPLICKYIGENANAIRRSFSSEDFFDPDEKIGEKTLLISLCSDEIYKMMELSHHTQKQAWGVCKEITKEEMSGNSMAYTNKPREDISIPTAPTMRRITEVDESKSEQMNSNGDSKTQQLQSIKQRIAMMKKKAEHIDSSVEIQTKDNMAGQGDCGISGYNACEDWGLLISNGYKMSIHSFFLMDSAVSWPSMRALRKEGIFSHKIALPMSEDEASVFFNSTRVIREFNNNGEESYAFYSYRGGRERVFRPYYYSVNERS